MLGNAIEEILVGLGVAAAEGVVAGCGVVRRDGLGRRKFFCLATTLVHGFSPGREGNSRCRGVLRSPARS